MTLLELVSMVKREAGISGATVTTVQSPVEEIARVVQWVNEAWDEVQNLHDQWQWMRSSFSLNTVAQTSTYSYTAATDTNTSAAIGSFANWKRDSFRKYLVANGPSNEQYLPYLDYDTFRNMYMFGTQRTNFAPPAVFTVDPQKRIVLGNSPDTIYNINGEYWTAPTALVLDADTPSMPAQFHRMIGWKALEMYGMYESAQEVVLKGQAHYGPYLARLEANQLPTITWGAPLA